MDFERWNDLLCQFLDELRVQFPAEHGLHVFRLAVVSAKALEPSKPCRMFVREIEPHADLLRARDARLFDVLGTIGGVDFGALWRSTSDQATRETTLDYVSVLFFTGQKLLA